MKMMNCFCVMVDQWKAFSFISSLDLYQRSSPSQISNTPWAGFEPAQNLSSGFDEWSCAVVITTALWHHKVVSPRQLGQEICIRSCTFSKVLNAYLKKHIGAWKQSSYLNSIITNYNQLINLNFVDNLNDLSVTDHNKYTVNC